MAFRMGLGAALGATVVGIGAWWLMRKARADAEKARSAAYKRGAAAGEEWALEKQMYEEEVPSTATGSLPDFVIKDLIAAGVVSEDAYDAFEDPTIDESYKLLIGPMGSVWIVASKDLAAPGTEAGTGIKGYGAYSQYWELPVSPDGIGPGGTDPTTIRKFTSQKPNQRSPVSFVSPRRPWTGTW